MTIIKLILKILFAYKKYLKDQEKRYKESVKALVIPDFDTRYLKMDEYCDILRYIDKYPVKDAEQLSKLMKYDKWLVAEIEKNIKEQSKND